MTSTPQLTLEDEKKLLERLQSGDRDAFRTLYEAFSDRLYRAVILPRVGVEDLAEDVLRDTFLTAFEKIGSLKWQGRSLFGWLARIAYNKVVDVHRRHKRTEKFVKGFTTHVEVVSEGPVGPEDAFLAEERALHVKELVHGLLDGLNPRYRRAVELRFFEQRSRQDCADAMDVKLGNFDVILFRAVKRLKTLYARQHEDDS